LVRSPEGGKDNATAWIESAQAPSIGPETSLGADSEQLPADLPETPRPRADLEGDFDSKSPSKTRYFLVAGAVVVVLGVGLVLRSKWPPAPSPTPASVTAPPQVTSEPQHQPLQPNGEPLPSQPVGPEPTAPVVSSAAPKADQQSHPAPASVEKTDKTD